MTSSQPPPGHHIYPAQPTTVAATATTTRIRTTVPKRKLSINRLAISHVKMHFTIVAGLRSRHRDAVNWLVDANCLHGKPSSSQYFQVQKANCIKLPGIAQNYIAGHVRLVYSRTPHFHFDDSILSKAPTVTRRGVLSRRSESQQQPVGHTSAQMRHTTLKTVQQESRVDSNRTCPVYGKYTIKIWQAQLHIFAGAKRSKQHCDTSRGLNAE